MEVPTATRALEAAERSLVPMAIGEPDFPSSPQVLAAAQRALTHGHIHYACARHGLAAQPSLLPGCAAGCLRRDYTRVLILGVIVPISSCDKQLRFAYLTGAEQLEEGVARLQRFPAPAT